MFRVYMKYTALLIGAYLALAHATSAGTLIKNGADGLAKIDTTLQGR